MFDFFIQRRLLSAEMWRSAGGGKNRKEVKKKIEKAQKGGRSPRGRPRSNDSLLENIYNDVLVPYYCIT